jgi:hypothetical protein
MGIIDEFIRDEGKEEDAGADCDEKEALRSGMSPDNRSKLIINHRRFNPRAAKPFFQKACISRKCANGLLWTEQLQQRDESSAALFVYRIRAFPKPPNVCFCLAISKFANGATSQVNFYFFKAPTNAILYRWEQLPIEEDAPEDRYAQLPFTIQVYSFRLLHSLVATHGELILFGLIVYMTSFIVFNFNILGGMFNEGTGMDCLNVGMERYTMSSDTYVLRPRYSEM